MSVRSFFRWLHPLDWPTLKGRRGAPGTPDVRFRPVLHTLEDRRLLSTITDLGALLGGGTSVGNVVNASGQVAGDYSADGGFANQGFYYDGSQTTLLNPFGGYGGIVSYADGLNDAGQVVGAGYFPNGDQHAFLWDNGTFTDLTTDAFFSVAYGINNSSQVVGFSSSGGPIHATLWDNGTVTDLGPLTGY